MPSPTKSHFVSEIHSQIGRYVRLIVVLLLLVVKYTCESSDFAFLVVVYTRTVVVVLLVAKPNSNTNSIVNRVVSYEM